MNKRKPKIGLIYAIKTITKPMLPFMPVVFLQIFQFFCKNYYIPELEFYIRDIYFFRIVQIFLILSFGVTVFKLDDFCFSYSQTLALNLLPVEFVTLILFAQYHVYMAVILICLCVASSVFFHMLVKSLVKKRQPSHDRCREMKKYRTVTFRFNIKAYALILLPAFVFSIYCLAGNVPLIKPSTSAANINMETLDADDNSAILYEKNIKQIAALGNDEWDTLNNEGKIDVLQHLTNLETTHLRINPIKIASNKLNSNTLGEYNQNEKTIYIDYEHLKSASAEEIINTTCHEVRHAYQHFVIDMLDWQSYEVQTAIFYKEARKWKSEFENYVDEKDFEQYYFQATEQDAREYAEERCIFIVICIENYSQ